MRIAGNTQVQFSSLYENKKVDFKGPLIASNKKMPQTKKIVADAL